jgi:dihydroflavonol-4-reductase
VTDAGVKRVILTSSVAATTPRGGTRVSFSDETVWTDLDDPEVSAYSRSKTLAERVAWDLVGASGGASSVRGEGNRIHVQSRSPW